MPGYRITAGDQTAVDNFGRGLGDIPYSGRIIASGSYNDANGDPAPAEFNTLGAQALMVIVDITAISGAGATLTVNIEVYDPASNKWIAVLTSAGLVGTGTTTLRVSPWTTASANVAAQFHLFKTMRVRPVKSGTVTTLTYSIGGHVQ